MIGATRFLVKKTREKGIKVILKHLFLSPLLEVLFKLLPYSPLRIFLLNILGARVSYASLVYGIRIMNYDIGSLRNLRVGKNVWLQPGMIIDVCDRVVIDDYASIGPGVVVLTHSKAGNLLDKVFPPKKRPVRIGKHTFIGSNAVIMADVGDKSVIGPCSVVNKDVPANSIAIGVPARVIREID